MSRNVKNNAAYEKRVGYLDVLHKLLDEAQIDPEGESTVRANLVGYMLAVFERHLPEPDLRADLLHHMHAYVRNAKADHTRRMGGAL